MALPEDPPPAGAPEWVVTYGDMMSLLLTFFIMLVSMSEIKQDNGKFRAMLDAIKQAFGPDLGTYGSPGTSLQKKSMYDKLASLGMSSEGGLLKSNRKSKGPGGANRTVRRIRDGNVVTLGGPVTFEAFSATLTPDLKKDLDVIAQVISHKPNRVEVRGHASPEPLPDDSPFRDAMDLSFERAHQVAQYLIAKGIDRHRILTSAASDTEPRTLTRGKDAQAANRRVDVFLIDSYIAHPEKAQSPTKSREKGPGGS